MYILEKEIKFEAAHQLNDCDSLTTKKCTNLHGHQWSIYITISVNKLKDDFVIDFGKLKEIINQLDHRNLNDIFKFNPSAENISKWIYRQIEKEIKNRLINLRITVEESPGSKITYTKRGGKNE